MSRQRPLYEPLEGELHRHGLVTHAIRTRARTPMTIDGSAAVLRAVTAPGGAATTTRSSTATPTACGPVRSSARARAAGGWPLARRARRAAAARPDRHLLASGSVALLADLIHNFGDAGTAIPLGIAFLLRSARAERCAGLFVVAAIFISACVAGVEAVSRLIHPQTPTHLLRARRRRR